MTFETVAILLAILAALGASGFFSAAELAIFSIHPPTLKALREHDQVRSQWLKEILGAPRKFLAIILLGKVFANALVAFSLVFLWHRLQGGGGHAQIWKLTLITTLLVLIIGELLPKAVARQRTARLALRFAGWILSVEPLLRPLAVPFQRLSEKVAMRLLPSSVRPQRGLTEAEYLTMLDVSTQEGTLRPAERRLIERTLALADHRLRELMVPRNEMRCLDAETELEAMKALARTMQHRRLPIYSDSLDSIVGVLNVKRLLVNPEVDVIDCIEPAAFVPETMTALELLKNFLRGPQRLAIVVDEFAGVEGLITLEDIIEEVFGEIYDEYDAVVPDWDEIEPGAILVRGRTRLPDISRKLQLELKAAGMNTLGGWLAGRLGTLPRVGDRVVWRGYTFQVERMNHLSVDAILVRRERRKP